jgi:hypothetical protein
VDNTWNKSSGKPPPLDRRRPVKLLKRMQRNGGGVIKAHSF